LPLARDEKPAPPRPLAAGPPALTPQARQLAEILLARQRRGRVVITQSQLCRLTGWDRKTVRKYLRELQIFGLIDWERRRRAPNVYWIFDGEGRVPEGETLISLVRRGTNVLIFGEPGVGKTYWLSRVAHDGHQAAFTVQLFAGSAKTVLVSMLNQLADAGLVEEIPRSPHRLSVQELESLVEASLSRAPGRVLVLLDELDRMPPSFQPWLARLVSHYAVQVVATARDQERVKWFLDHAWLWQVPPLSRTEVEDWVRTFINQRNIPVVGGEKGMARLVEHVWRQSQGNPRKVQGLLRQIEARGYVDYRAFREIRTSETFRILDLTWILVATVALVIAVRYMSLGLGDRMLYVAAGILYGGGMLIRYFAYRWRRPMKR